VQGGTSGSGEKKKTTGDKTNDPEKKLWNSIETGTNLRPTRPRALWEKMRKKNEAFLSCTPAKAPEPGKSNSSKEKEGGLGRRKGYAERGGPFRETQRSNSTAGHSKPQPKPNKGALHRPSGRNLLLAESARKSFAKRNGERQRVSIGKGNSPDERTGEAVARSR